MNDLAYDLALHLEAQGLGSQTPNAHTWLIRVSRFRDASTQPQIVVTATGGEPRNRSYSDGGRGLRRPTAQIRVRGEPGDYTGAREKIEAVQALLDGAANVTINGHLYQTIEALTPPLWLGWTEDTDRAEWSLNVRATYYHT